jgi:hypothetical protein
MGARAHRSGRRWLAAMGWALFVDQVLVAPVWAAGASATIEESASSTAGKSTDSSGKTTQATTTTIDQRYVLSLNRAIYSRLILDLAGTYDWALGESTARGQGTSSFDNRNWNGSGRLSFGDPALNGSVAYDRGEVSSSERSLGVSTSSPTLVRETWSSRVGWQPSGLPPLTLTFSRASDYDRRRLVSDTTSTDVGASTNYAPVAGVDLGYAVRYSRLEDTLNRNLSTDLSNSGQASWRGSLFDGRTSMGVSLGAGNDVTDTIASGQGGTIATKQSATGGLSTVEAFPATPTQVTLNPNPALVDGDVNSSAGLDIGFGPTVASAPDTALRDVGLQFAAPPLPVNTLYVWVDKPLPPAVSGAYVWSVYSSDDNVKWAPVILTGGVVFGTFQNRFEISIPGTKAKYLKVTVRPLDPGVTSDRRFANVLVTELQALLVQPAAAVKGSRSSSSGTLNASLNQWLSRSLSYNFSGVLTERTGAPATYGVANGISWVERLTRTLGASARVQRSDSDFGLGHVAAHDWGGNLNYTPLRTVAATAGYSGQLTIATAGTSYSNAVTAGARAQLYQGASVSTSGTASLGRNNAGQSVTSVSAAAAATVAPHPTLTLTTTSGYARSEQGGAGASLSSKSWRIDGTASWAPVPAISASVGISRVAANALPRTLLNFSGAVSPLSGGDVLLHFSYQESLDPTADQRTRSYGPSLRWNIRQGAALDAGYSVASTHTRALTTSGNTLFATLVIQL